MPAHSNHHYVPAFLLREWEGGTDGKLSAMRWANGRVIESRRKAQAVGKRLNLYSVRQSTDAPDHGIETELMTKRIDDPAAAIHKILLKTGFETLDELQQHTWAAFLFSLAVRGPGAIEYVRAKGRKAFSEELDADPDGLMEVRGESPESSLREYVEKHVPDLLSDFGMFSLPHIFTHSLMRTKVYEAQWLTRRLSPNSPRLLIVDRPLGLQGSLSSNFLLHLPLAPDLMLLIYNQDHTRRRIEHMNDATFVKAMNRASVEQASESVFGVDDKHLPLLQRRLEKFPAGPGLGIGPRPPT